MRTTARSRIAPRKRARVLMLALTAALIPLVPAFGQDSAKPTVSWKPERPVQGTLFRVYVTPAPAGAVTGKFAGEPLHFTPADGAALEALAAAPLDEGSALNLEVIVAGDSGRADTIRARVPIAQGSYALEKLTVAPRFGAPPDSATENRIARERERALAVSRASHTTPRLWSTLVRPRDARMTSGFGSGREFNGKVQSRHTGTDFAGAVGSPVRSAARGVVALVDTFYLAGGVIYIDHGEGLVSAYFHLSGQDVAPGDTVQAGQPIGRVGATGRVTGPHLHWVVRYGEISVDPLSLIALSSSSAPKQDP
jgi:murein DD-endopeptidase MepM/ murein hydrolase activator NlpD